jgi:hypothetical protein
MSSMMARNPWFRAGFYAWSLGLEASSVIALRTLKIALGGSAAEAEAHRMVSEKIDAGLTLQALALRTGTPQDRHPRFNGRVGQVRRWTLRWREMDSNPRSPAKKT